MARVNIYLPDELAVRVREAGLNISAVARSALEDALARTAMGAWLEKVANLSATSATHEDVIAALDADRDEIGDFADR